MQEYASAILLTVQNELILQIRDNKSGIADPGMLSLFAGALKAGEDPLTAIKRELLEEISYVPARIDYLMRFEEQGFDPRISHVFICHNVDPSKIEVKEGLGYQAVPLNEDLSELNLAPISLNILNKFIQTN